MTPRRLVIAGGSGFIGTALAAECVRLGWHVVVLTRSPRTRSDGVLEAAWDGANPGPWSEHLEGAEAVINLTGKNVNCPHTPENLRGIAESRVKSVQALATAIRRVQKPPRVWVQASATGYYGDTRDRICDETAPPGSDALARICCDWEGTFQAGVLPATRPVVLRVGLVLGQAGGALPVLVRLTRMFLGGSAGSGRQFVSWIHQVDLVRLMIAALTDDTMSGTYNAVGPNPVTNAELMRALCHALHRPWSPPAPVLAVKLGAWLTRSDPYLALVSQRCVPARLTQSGFPFQFTELAAALRDLCGQP